MVWGDECAYAREWGLVTDDQVKLLMGGLGVLGTVAAYFAPQPGFLRRRNGHSKQLSDEPATVEFRTKMGMVMERQQHVTERLEAHMGAQTGLLTRLTESIEAHQEAFQQFVKEAKWTPRRRRT